jgi:hypothetical protein
VVIDVVVAAKIAVEVNQEGVQVVRVLVVKENQLEIVIVQEGINQRSKL